MLNRLKACPNDLDFDVVLKVWTYSFLSTAIVTFPRMNLEQVF
jgi:hypothetical protein